MKRKRRKKQKIEETLKEKVIPLSTNVISEHVDLSWNTAKKYLKEMKQEGIVNRENNGNVVLWSLEKEVDNPGDPISKEMSVQFEGKQYTVRIPQIFHRHPLFDFDDKQDVEVTFDPSKPDRIVVEKSK